MSDNDNRNFLSHLVHAIGHKINYELKKDGKKGIEESETYKNKSPDKAKKGPWPKEVDEERAKYHIWKFNEQMEKMDNW